MHGHHPETHNYRPTCAWTGLAAPRRPSLVIQKVHRLGVGVANNRQARAKAEGHTLYASHTVWKHRATFEAWTKSEAFSAAHARAGDNKPLYLGHPQFEGFEAIQNVGSEAKTA